MPWSTAEDLNKDLEESVTDGLRLTYCSCGIELQSEHVAKLQSLHDRLLSLRNFHIGDSDERHANEVFRAQMLVSGTKNFLEMWVRLKESQQDKAWECLVEAQNDFEIAQRIVFDPGIDKILQDLAEVEKTTFPPQMFFSSAYTFPEAFCSICNQPYGDCEHVRGRIYMGQICRRRIPNSTFTESSIVLSPKDKRCRIAEYTEDGAAYCTLTHREVQRSTPVDPALKYVSGVVQYFD